MLTCDKVDDQIPTNRMMRMTEYLEHNLRAAVNIEY
jgi:hypothetical protein